MTKNLFADVSSHNPDTPGYFQALKNTGCKGVVIKLTEGTYYTNPLARNQIANTKSHGMKVNAYHFARFTSVGGAQAEANYFLRALKSHGVGTDAVVVNDFEATHASVAALNAFYGPLEAAGYKNISIYSMRSWLPLGTLTAYGGLNGWPNTGDRLVRLSATRGNTPARLRSLGGPRTCHGTTRAPSPATRAAPRATRKATPIARKTSKRTRTTKPNSRTVIACKTYSLPKFTTNGSTKKEGYYCLL